MSVFTFTRWNNFTWVGISTPNQKKNSFATQETGSRESKRCRSVSTDARTVSIHRQFQSQFLDRFTIHPEVNPARGSASFRSRSGAKPQYVRFELGCSRTGTNLLHFSYELRPGAIPSACFNLMASPAQTLKMFLDWSREHFLNHFSNVLVSKRSVSADLNDVIDFQVTFFFVPFFTYSALPVIFVNSFTVLSPTHKNFFAAERERFFTA